MTQTHLLQVDTSVWCLVVSTLLPPTVIKQEQKETPPKIKRDCIFYMTLLCVLLMLYQCFIPKYHILIIISTGCHKHLVPVPYRDQILIVCEKVVNIFKQYTVSLRQLLQKSDIF